MTYKIDQKGFNAIIKGITTSKAKFRAEVQGGLIAATYLCLKHSGGTTPFQQLLDAVGTTAHRQGITKWAETYAPVMLEKGKLILNKSAYKLIDLEAAIADFDTFITEGRAVMWDEIAKDENKTVSVFNLDTALDNFLKKLEKNELGGLAKALRDAEQAYMLNAIKGELAINDGALQQAA